MRFLGVDGGGTKTAFVLIDENYEVLAEHELATCYHLEVGIEGARDILHSGIHSIVAKAACQVSEIDYAFLGLPAFGEDSTLHDTLASLPSPVLQASQYQCGNDMVNGWAAAFGAKDGINIVAGTGSIAYGQNKGLTARCGGWGEIFSDEGSAHWIGQQALQAFTKMSDGRLPRTELYDLLKQKLGIHYDLDVTRVVMTEWGADRSKIASLSTIVSDAAIAGDATAIALFSRAAKELADIVDGVRKQLKYLPKDIVNVSYSGGVFKASQFVLSPFKNALAQCGPQYQLHPPLFTPVIGAAIYAKTLWSRR